MWDSEIACGLSRERVQSRMDDLRSLQGQVLDLSNLLKFELGERTTCKLSIREATSEIKDSINTTCAC